MTDADRISKLEEEVEILRARCDDLLEALKLECANTTEHIRKFQDFDTDMNAYVTQLLHKVFPNIEKGFDEVTEAMRKASRSSKN